MHVYIDNMSNKILQLNMLYRGLLITVQNKVPAYDYNPKQRRIVFAKAPSCYFVSIIWSLKIHGFFSSIAVDPGHTRYYLLAK